MPYERLLKARKKTIGTKQTMKSIERGQAKVVYIAGNAERHVIDPIIKNCAAKGVEVIEVDTMLELGKACGIEVGCASAAVVED
ncbi:ribosomal L7Ae family protein [Desulfocucumis palustris]|uniref:Ribosomal L7Ae family protein n=1 Tax=Desulfocucumis palustris TaxID=1898651 RepID=A0A2L2XAR8_9FIRM|nr:ribosomal L7Ae/L30e/S12e/Gadd45 family protein [Desulfocucumis palustris]GBF33367.1 ribosomal L7Ae family protein [Desulfocucumis palustris]